jgi:hypothetical protein
MAKKATTRKPGKKRVPFWVTMDMTPLYMIAVIAAVLGFAFFVGRVPKKGSIHVCMDAYAAARTAADSERVDAERPFDTPKMRASSCGTLRETPEYARVLREQQEKAARRGHA